ncbi:ankyrin-3-like isoform X2 [Ruditapes philippinarum]|uniref:ankyrin-3-like isoform X2 n=1 Tax=Ruditapes philippinarum TaxID=129788 RepID=UPI00295B5DDD|nr:ankyrin-3-like isoform X2 [Ruditapes philippinarum]
MAGRFLESIGLRKGSRKPEKEFESSHSSAGEEQDFVNQVEEFSQSVDISNQRTRSASTASDTSSFVQSVQVVPSSSSEGKYAIYKSVHDYIDPSRLATDSEVKYSFLSSLQYGHNISNPELRQQRFENDYSDWKMRKRSLLSRSSKNGSSSGSRFSSSSNSSGNFSNKNCQCGQFHSHVFKPEHRKMSKLVIPVPEEQSPVKKTSDILHGNENQKVISNIFWKPQLSFSEYKHGCDLVKFQSLWPSKSTIKSLLEEGMECVERDDFGLRGAISELCVLVTVDGPVYILQSLLEMKYIRLDYQFENDAGLLHLACVLQNLEAVQLITQLGVSSKIKDRSGKTAGEVCTCPKIKKQLNTKFLSDRIKNLTIIKPGLQDKDAIFKLASNPKCLYELQKRLQTFYFDVNGDTKGGDYLIHVVAKTGICQLPVLMSLVRLQHADINLCNSDGLTPLMIVARDGDSNYCDILMCVLGADPNKQNEENGRTALHYAVSHNHVNVVNCLVKRGADVNVEDKDKCRPDDVTLLSNSTEDCKEIVQLHREQRCQHLSSMVKNAEQLTVDTSAVFAIIENEDAVYPIDLRPTDLTVVDSDYNTLIMVAASNAKIHNLETLLSVSKDTIDAQHTQTGLTALAMAAKAGHDACCDILLGSGACATIQDMDGFLPIHHAVLQSHEKVVEVFRQHFPVAYVGLFKSLRYCRKSSIHDILNVMFEKRQAEMIIPQLRLSAMDGNAEKLFCLLEDGDNVNSKSDLSSQSVLFAAVENRHVEVVRLLVEKGADLKKRDIRTANTVLHIASQTGHLETANYLLPFCKESENQSSTRNRLDINAVNNDKKTALQIASEKGYIQLTSLLIDFGATTALLDSKGSLYTSPEFEGARVLIEGHRNEHTQAVMKLVSDKSRKAPFLLIKIWVPRFDHNLRDKNGDTPLMVACRSGRLETVNFLLQSAVYANQISDDDLDNSDTDSGVLDLPPWKSRIETINEDLMKSLERSGENEYLPNLAQSYDRPAGANCDFSTSLNPSNLANTLPGSVYAKMEQNKVSSYLTDVERPKGLYIYHDGIVSHICAVNLFDGNTPLHRTIEGGDNVAIATALIEADAAVINMQNDAGLTPIHLACKLGRKKILERLLMVPGIDLNLPTLNGHLPEEVTTNKTLIKMVQKVRKEQPVRQPPTPEDAYPSSVSVQMQESLPSVRSRGGETVISFDKINDLYNTLKDT